MAKDIFRKKLFQMEKERFERRVDNNSEGITVSPVRRKNNDLVER